MKTQKLFIGLGSVAAILVIYFGWSLLKTADYKGEILSAREEKAIWMSTSLESPFNEQQVVFEGLNYFDPDPSFNITADFQKNQAQEELTLIANDGETRQYTIYGTAVFTISNVPCSLLVLSSESELGTKMFIPFMDETSGQETYGAGRYLEAALPLVDKIQLDFNEAYNPYCAYMDGYTCPFPPKANKLSVAVLAGEKVY